MPKGSVPRNTTASVTVKKNRYFELANQAAGSTPKKKRPTQKEVDKAKAAYFDALDYPSLYTSGPYLSKEWYNKKGRAKWENKFKEDLKDMADGQYSKERRVARDVRSDKAVGPRIKKIPAPVGKGGR